MKALQPPLVDAGARNRVITDLASTLFVEAGAGSGKTTSLVKRIVKMVASGVPIGRIAAITFTEAAARELRQRVRGELEQAGLDRGDQHVLNASGQVESAAFTTLHGFALRLLADHPVEAGLPPGFGVVDEIGSMLEFEERWRVFAGQIGDDLDLLDLQERASVLGVELRRFIDIARRFNDNWDLLSLIDDDPPALSALDVANCLDDIQRLGALADHCLDPSDLLATALLQVAEMAELVATRDPLSQLEWLTEVKWPRMNVGRKSNWVRMDIDDVRRQVRATQATADGVVDALRVEVINHFVARIAAFVDTQVGHRRSAGELAFHDLLVLARRLLRTNDGVREELHQRYSRVLLDEFQDTDPIQIELAVLLCSDGPVGDHPWQDLAAKLQPGRLAVVGDPKQSIYRFRRADISVYADAEAALVSETTRLVSNFRSVPGIVDFVNHFFGHLIGGGEPGAQPAYTELAPVRAGDSEPDTEMPVLVIGGPHDRSVPVGEIREREAADVAALICEAMASGWRTERDGNWLPLRLQDIAVLIPSRLSLPALEAAFGAANLPFRPETNSLVYATQEVRDVMAGVRAVVNPANSVDVVAALRSSLFALGDDDLLSWKQGGGSWNYQIVDVRDDMTTHPVVEAFSVLARWHGARWWCEPSSLIDRIVRERRLREAALAEPRPRDRWRRYRFLAEQAREFTATRGGDLQDFVAWVEIQSSDLARVTEPIPAEPDDDAVRVLTVHGSKGLEFPLVVLAGAPTRDQNRAGGAQVLFPRDRTPEVKLAKGKATTQFDIHASVEEVLDNYERIRLHYVAATRARDLLVVSAHHKEGLRSSGRRTWEALEKCSGLWQRYERRGDERYRVEPPTQLRLSSGSYADTEAQWRAEQERLLATTSTAGTASATGLAEQLSGRSLGVEYDGPLPAREPSAGAGGPARISSASATATATATAIDGSSLALDVEHHGAAVGTAVHATLQDIDFDASDDLQVLARLHAGRVGRAEAAQDVASMVGQALATPTIGLARQHKHWRELHVAAPLSGRLVEGFVDLCIETPDGLIVVDYKTDHISNDSDVGDKVALYSHQAAAYALLLEHVTGRQVVECRFLFLGPSHAIERSVGDLDDRKAAILRSIESPIPSTPG